MTQTQIPVVRYKRGLASAVLLAVLGGAFAAPIPSFAASAVPTAPVISTTDTTWQYLDDGSDRPHVRWIQRSDGCIPQ